MAEAVRGSRLISSHAKLGAGGIWGFLCDPPTHTEPYGELEAMEVGIPPVNRSLLVLKNSSYIVILV